MRSATGWAILLVGWVWASMADRCHECTNADIMVCGWRPVAAAPRMRGLHRCTMGRTLGGSPESRLVGENPNSEGRGDACVLVHACTVWLYFMDDPAYPSYGLLYSPGHI